ncbi:hypothetical protein GURASL_18250 [Geotalea uraniireducens]|uniref:Nephrocystin 3-like N-terminal domain-containing protein n=1 Tax=Geotalea uraniireducens TaxID=351604 RepID=A0ABN6VTW4_9BACT|nr:NACHT domain-containing protein [Geotalea uraniireducens]BDV42902.1 hypothetical protein GURASL_18250 [Geotalea uraniireducens]
MDRFIKSSAITFGGYIYQNLIGLELLCDWLDDPGKFEWVKFEADEDETPKGLDDIVARLAGNGKRILLQVKFTVDPFDEKNLITWDWLLHRKPKGKSLLQKWTSAFVGEGADNIAEAALVSNRRPDRDFYECLDSNSRVILSKVSLETKTLIIEQLGSEKIANQFFQAFEFRHSHKGYLSLQRTLLDRYVPKHTAYHGWHVLFSHAIDWALRKNFPLPDGSITLGLIRGALDRRRPEPISESFRVPDGYCPPDITFNDVFIERLTKSDQNLSILWGSPGQGKSTYLSFVCDKLDELSVPYIRHHYFLDLSDTSDRFSLTSVANSLMAQMENVHAVHIQGLRDSPEHLREWIEACGRCYAVEGKRFVVIIDGLDHVWRENDRDRRPLESLFSQLLPCTNNVAVVLGTQRVSDEQLPSQLLKFSEDNDWIELPRMSLVAIRSWLDKQFSAQRFEIPNRNYPVDHDPLTDLAESFQQISDGHPLHLTYSFEFLMREHRQLTPDIVNELPECPDGDIKKYYRTLWQKLSYGAKDALHLVAATKFIWPTFGLEDCLGISGGELNREISHLFYATEAGNVPFHGSILAFVRDVIDHEKRVTYLLPFVIEWLEKKAPEYHKWGWLWLMKARNGQQNDLVNTPTRDWIIDSLARGYPQPQTDAILSAAERFAFESKQFARAVRLRWLKIRLQNGTKYQIQNFDRLYECALTLCEDDYPLRNLSAGLHAATIDELHLLGRQYLLMHRVADTAECQEEIRKRINDRLHAGAYDKNSLKKMSEQFLELAAATGQYKPELLLKSISSFKEISNQLFIYFLRELAKRNDLSLLTVFLNHDLSDVKRVDLELSVLRLAGVCHARLHEWPEFVELQAHPFVSCWALLYAPQKTKKIDFTPNISVIDELSPINSLEETGAEFLHRLFFHTLAECLELSGVAPVISIADFNNRSWLNSAVKHIVRIASSTGAMLARGNAPGFSHCYRLLAEVKMPDGYDNYRDYNTFRKALLAITMDTFLLTSLRSGCKEIDDKEWSYLTGSKHFLFSEWLEGYIASGHKLLSDVVVHCEIERRLAKELGRVSQFNDRAQTYLELCELAVFHGMNELASRLLKKGLACVMGYGAHKDMTMSYVLNAVEAVTSQDIGYCQNALRRLCPAIANIDEFTDGDDIRHIKLEMTELLFNQMPASYTAYFEHLMKSGEWYEAEQVLSILLKYEPLDSPIIKVVTTGIWDSHTVGALRDRADKGEVAAHNIIDENAVFFGTTRENLGKERYSNSSHTDEEHGIDVTAFAPDALKALLDELRTQKKYVSDRKAVRDWFTYWVLQRHELELLRGIEPFLNEDSIPYEVAELLDDVFNMSLKLEGKKKAYKWIVAAQIYRHGWSEYYAEEDALKRFSVIKQHYSDRWQEFVIDTSKSPYQKSTEALVIPSHRLVHLLLAIGKVPEAKEVTEEMISTVIEEVSEQPLDMPYWYIGK